MKSGLLVIALLIAGAGQAGQPQTSSKPLDKDAIAVLVRAGAETERLVKMVQERGIDFDPTSSYLQTLRDAGASEVLLKALLAAKKATNPGSDQGGLLELQLSASDKVWVSVDADGKPALERVLNPRETATVSARDFFDITVDNGQVLSLVFQNEGLGPIGSSTSIKSAHLTRQDLTDMLAAQKARQAAGPASRRVEQAGQISPASPPRVGPPGSETSPEPGDVVYQVGGDVAAPVPIHKPKPEYTTEAVRAKLSGNIVLGIIVDAHGKVTHAHVIKGLGKGLDESALETIRKWKFKPATRGGVPVAVRYEIEFQFNASQ